jgi:hypothetical protein
MSGMRASETGSERPTGTPGSGTPIPFEPGLGGPAASERERGQGTPAGGGGGGPAPGADGPLGNEDGRSGNGAPGDAVVSRVARARCDRETYCNRVGEGKAFGTGEQCTNVLRERARADVVGAGCDRGFETSQLGMCLNAIRQAPCDVRIESMQTIESCQSREICTP